MTRTDARPRLRPITLAFVDPREEARYTNENSASAKEPIRGAAVAGLVVLLLFGYLAYLMFPGKYGLIWMFRGSCALYVILAFVLTYTSYYWRFMQPVMALGTVLCAMLAVWMIYFTKGLPFCRDLYVGILICV